MVTGNGAISTGKNQWGDAQNDAAPEANDSWGLNNDKDFVTTERQNTNQERMELDQAFHESDPLQKTIESAQAPNWGQQHQPFILEAAPTLHKDDNAAQEKKDGRQTYGNVNHTDDVNSKRRPAQAQNHWQATLKEALSPQQTHPNVLSSTNYYPPSVVSQNNSVSPQNANMAQLQFQGMGWGEERNAEGSKHPQEGTQGWDIGLVSGQNQGQNPPPPSPGQRQVNGGW